LPKTGTAAQGIATARGEFRHETPISCYRNVATSEGAYATVNPSTLTHRRSDLSRRRSSTRANWGHRHPQSPCLRQWVTVSVRSLWFVERHSRLLRPCRAQAHSVAFWWPRPRRTSTPERNRHHYCDL